MSSSEKWVGHFGAPECLALGMGESLGHLGFEEQGEIPGRFWGPEHLLAPLPSLEEDTAGAEGSLSTE